MLTIVWDVDDVLNDLMRIWFEHWWLLSHAECTITYNQISENPPHRLLGITLAEYLASLDKFRCCEIARKMVPVPEVLEWFRQYGGHYRHVAVTMTSLRAAPASAAWVMQHFGKWIRSFHLVPSPRQGEEIPVYDQTKKDFLRWWGKGDIVVDDIPSNVASAQTLDIQGVLIPRPWNQSQLTLAEVLGVLTKLAQ